VVAGVSVVRVLAVSDEVDDSLGPESLRELGPQLVVSCGDLPFHYLEYLVTLTNVPLVYVPGNHDPELRRRPRGPILTGTAPLRFAPEDADQPGPGGGINLDGRVLDVAGLRVAGLGGSVRYRTGPNQYTQAEMRRRALGLELRCGRRRPVAAGPRHRLDLFVSHAPPMGVGDLPDDPAHVGFAAFHRLVRTLAPRVLLHGHIHPYGRVLPHVTMGDTVVRNVVGAHLIEVEAGP
jgi:predicted phosphodiesterase